jgi:NADPH:quinone reductase-like Zn-dependent oxidoreductase
MSSWLDIAPDHIADSARSSPVVLKPVVPCPGKSVINTVVLAAYAETINAEDPLAGLVVGERPEPMPPDERWTTIQVKAAALNHHDVWSLRGVGLPAERLPMILGCDAAGIDQDGNEVIVHAVIGDDDWSDDETLDPKRRLLSELHQGTLAQRLTVPKRNLLPKPPELSFEQAACLPCAWLTAYRMLFTRGRVTPGQTVLVQGSSGGVATALIVLASHAGIRVWATARTEQKRELALGLGADGAFEPGARLPERVDAVMETTGAATWTHSIKALKPGGQIVISGATTGDASPAQLTRIFYLQLSVIGSTMGTRSELQRLLRFMVDRKIEPVIARTLPLHEARQGFEAMLAGDTHGKIVFSV